MSDLRQAAEQAREALTKLSNYAARNVCMHEETHRGGVLWEICNWCGAKWADDEGGKPPYEEPAELIAAADALASLEEALSSPAAPIEAAQTSAETLREALQEILRVHANDDKRPKAFYIASEALASAPPAAATVEVPDERILHLWDTHVAYESNPNRPQQPPLTDKDKLAFARAVLATSARAALSTPTEGGEVPRDGLIPNSEHARKAKRCVFEMRGGFDICVALDAVAAIDALDRIALAGAPTAPKAPVAWRVRGYSQFRTGQPREWRYVDGSDRPKVNIPEDCDFEPLYARPTPAAAAGVPPGYVLVPREPTQAMLDAADHWNEPQNVWSAMLAAAGAPAGAPTKGEQQ